MLRTLEARVLWPMSWAITSAFIFIFATGCTTVGPVHERCTRVAVDASPSWAAAASWTGRGDHLLIVDPAIQGLLAFDLDGRLVERLESPELAGLDYSQPIRVEAAGRSTLVGGRSGVLELRRRGVSPVHDEVDGVARVYWGDWTRVEGEALVGYADVEIDDQNWGQGFVRIGRDGVQRLLDLPLVRGGEFEKYHHYYLRPYVAQVGDEAYILRYTEPVSVSKVGEHGLQEVWRADADEGTADYLALVGWQDALFLVAREEGDQASVEQPEIVAPTPRNQAAPGLELQAMAPVEVAKRWVLVRLDPESGEIVWRRRLPVGQRPVLAPGPRAWALVEGKSRLPRNGETSAEPMWLTFVPPERFGAHPPATLCAGLEPVTASTSLLDPDTRSTK